MLVILGVFHQPRVISLTHLKNRSISNREKRCFPALLGYSISPQIQAMLLHRLVGYGEDAQLFWLRLGALTVNSITSPGY